jgi:hypothetical protein
MSAGEERNEHLVDDLILPDDDPPEFCQDAGAPFRNPLRTDRRHA